MSLTVTTPVPESIAKAASPSPSRQEFAVAVYVTTLVVPSESVASAVTPTAAALSAFSATVFVALSASEGAPTSNSS